MTSRKPFSRVALAAFIFGGGAVLWIIGQGPAAVSAAAQAQAQSYFMGGNPSRVDTKMTVAALRFPKGSRSNWHSHGTGQMLMVQEGKALTQEAPAVRSAKCSRTSRGGRRAQCRALARGGPGCRPGAVDDL